MIDPDNLSNRELTAKVADLEKRLAAIEALIAGEPPPPRVVEAWVAEAARVRLPPDTRVSDAVRERDTLGRRDVMGAPHTAR